MVQNKKGTTTLFLAIILSALILVESTYVAYVADLNRRLTASRALKLQCEAYLADYDRELFKTYGIYAFNSTEIDSDVFNRVLTANGYSEGEVFYVCGMYEFDTEDLRRAVSCFYAYRSTGILFDRFSGQIVEMLSEIDKYGILDKIGQFTSSSAAGWITAIAEGGAEVASAVASVMEFLGIDDQNPAMKAFNNLFSTLKSIGSVVPNPDGGGFSPSDMNVLRGLLEFSSGFYDVNADLIDEYAFHPFICDYAARNFDCQLEETSAINGTGFDKFHDEGYSDSEYLLTGLSGFAGEALTDYYVFSVLFVKCIVSIMMDNTKRETIRGISEILMMVISVLTAGTVSLPAEVYEVVIVLIMAVIDAAGDLGDVLDGESVEIIGISDGISISAGYRDFLGLFMLFVPDETLLQRMVDLFNRDFPDYITGVYAESDIRGGIMTYDTCYELYSV